MNTTNLHADRGRRDPHRQLTNAASRHRMRPDQYESLPESESVAQTRAILRYLDEFGNVPRDNIT